MCIRFASRVLSLTRVFVPRNCFNNCTPQSCVAAACDVHGVYHGCPCNVHAVHHTGTHAGHPMKSKGKLRRAQSLRDVQPVLTFMCSYTRVSVSYTLIKVLTRQANCEHIAVFYACVEVSPILCALVAVFVYTPRAAMQMSVRRLYFFWG